MSGIDVDVVQNETNGPQGADAITKPTVEVVFDTVRPANGMPANPNADAGISSRVARGIAALQKAGGGVGKVPPAAAEPAAAQAGAEKAPKGLEVSVVDPEKEAAGAENGADAADPAEKEAVPAEIDAAKATEAAGNPDLEQIRSDLALAQARIEALTSGDLDDDSRMGWIEKPVDWIRAEVAKRMGAKPDSDAVDKALSHFQWELTLDRMGVAKEALPKDIQDRNNGEHAERRKALAKVASDAQGAAKAQTEGRAAVHKLVDDQLAASAAKFPHAAAGADLKLGGVSAAEAAIFLWGEAVKRGEVKNTGDDAKDIPEAIRLYDKFCKTRLGTKLQLQNATPPPAITPAASKEAATGAKKTATTVSQRQAASAPTAKTVTKEPEGPEVIDASDLSGRTRRMAQVARKHFGPK